MAARNFFLLAAMGHAGHAEASEAELGVASVVGNDAGVRLNNG